MPTSKYFSQCPDFPSDPIVPVANIPTLSFAKLQHGDSNESLKLYNGCRDHGFLMLDFKDSQDGEILLRDGEKMFDLIQSTFNLEQEVLNKYACDAPRDLTGYKRAGVMRTEDNKRDAIEVYTLSQDDVLGNSPARANPMTIEAHRDDCRNFFLHAYAAVKVVLDCLDQQLDLDPGTLAARCPLNKSSATAARLLLSRGQTPGDDRRINFGGHTDIGLITLLFNVSGGLQVLPAGKENVDKNWRYVRPREGCAIVNIADTLTEWTGGLLRSSLHRVVSPPGAQAIHPRQSLAYLVRAERNATIQRFKTGKVIPPLIEGDEEDTRKVEEWAAWRAQQIIDGVLKSQNQMEGNQKGYSKYRKGDL